MEIFTIVLSALLGLLSPLGFVVDRIAENAIRDQLDAAESLSVRIDNAPNYQLVQGRVDRVRIAGRGLYPIEDVRIAVAELETDAIAVDPASLRRGRPRLEKPLQLGVRLVLTEEDLNRALQSEAIAGQLRNLSLDALGGASEQLEQYDIVDPKLELDRDRVRLQVTLKQRRSEFQSQVSLESGIAIRSGKQLQLIDPTANLNGQAVPPELIQLLTAGVGQRLNLDALAEAGITARILNFQIDADALALAAFVRIDPQFTSED